MKEEWSDGAAERRRQNASSRKVPACRDLPPAAAGTSAPYLHEHKISILAWIVKGKMGISVMRQ
jgi:hypothetical protein